MFEDIQQHRAAVAENIQKALEIGFTGNELEKAHKVGDIHPNGKWVWTQLPSGKFDWRVIKKTSAGSGAAAPSTAQKTAQSGKKEEEIKGFINILKQKPNERHLEQMDVDELKRFIDTANKCWLDDENLNRSTRQQCKEWRDLAKKELASKDEEVRATQQEQDYRKKHPNSVTKNSDIQQQASSGNKGEKEASVDYKDVKSVSDFLTKKFNISSKIENNSETSPTYLRLGGGGNIEIKFKPKKESERIRGALYTSSQFDDEPVFVKILDDFKKHPELKKIFDKLSDAGFNEATNGKTAQWGTWKFAIRSKEDLKKFGEIYNQVFNKKK